jgi:hypothetical protein
MKTDIYTKSILTIIAICLLYIVGRDIVTPVYADRKEIIDVNIAEIAGKRLSLYDATLPVKVVKE